MVYYRPWLAHMKDKTQSKMERKHNTRVTGGNTVEPAYFLLKTAYKVHFSRIHAQKNAKNPFGGWLLFLDFSKEMQNSFIEPQQKFPKKHIPSVFVNVKEIWPTVILLNIVDRIVTLLRASSQLVTDVEWERPLTGFRS